MFLSEIVCFAKIFVEEIILGEDRTTEEERMHIMEGWFFVDYFFGSQFDNEVTIHFSTFYSSTESSSQKK